MTIIKAITQVAVKFPIWEHSARKAIVNGGSDMAEFVNVFFDQYNETDGNAKQMEDKLGIEVVVALYNEAEKIRNAIVLSSNPSLEYEKEINKMLKDCLSKYKTNECIKEDLK